MLEVFESQNSGEPKYLLNVFCHGNIPINVPGKVPTLFLSHSVSCTEGKIKNF